MALACLEKLKIAWKEYRGAKIEAASLRKAFLEDKIARKAHNRKVTSKDIIKMLRKEQRSIQEGFESRQIRGRNNKKPILKAEMTDFITGITKTVYTQEEIVIAAVESNRRCQPQTVGTAFRKPALFDAFEPCADNEENCLVFLDGTFIPHLDADPYAVSLLETMVQPQSLLDKGPINCVPTPVENVENVEAWQRQKDITGVLSSIPTNAHHKCCSFDPILNDIDCMMRSTPLEFDFTPKKWCSLDDLEILKKVGRINIEEIRLIQLMHPEYQINNKNIGRKVLANAEIYNEVVEEQHGSRKHHQAGLLLLNKVLVEDLFRLSRYSGCYAMNDAKGCYDRIDHTIAILVLMVFGVLWMIAPNMFFVIQQACHRIKTGYGVSRPVYGNEDANNPIAGIGKGNGLGPSLWCLISTIIIKCYKRKGHNFTIITPISNRTVSLLGFSFVDDADLVTVANNDYQSGGEMIQKMQAFMTDWCGCIRVTGGLIAPTKTRWFLVSFFWNGNDWEY